MITMLLALNLLTGCATNQSLSLQERNEAYAEYIDKQKLQSQDKIRTFNFNGWQALSNHFKQYRPASSAELFNKVNTPRFAR